MKKKHLPKKQLLEMKKVVKEMSIKRGLRIDKSFIDEITHDTSKTVLPGLPPYLPHQWTIKASQRMMYDLLILWRIERKGVDEDNITDFFKFVIAEFDTQLATAKKEMEEVPKLFSTVDNVPVLKDVFAPLQKKQTTTALQKFYVDSFAIAVMVKQNDTVSDYAEWFLDWTEELDKYWTNSENNATDNI